MIPVELLISYNAQMVSYVKDDHIFFENEHALYYYQVVKGTIKMYNLTEDGKEFIQGVFGPGKSFGEPPLFSDFRYPASAKAGEKTTLLKMPRMDFFSFLKAHPEIHFSFTKTLSDRLFYKAIILKEVSSYPPEHRIVTLLRYLKKQQGLTDTQKYVIPLTRQEIAELTGLRTETVIRSIKKLEKEAVLSISDRKVII